MEVVEKASLADRRANALAGEVEEARSLLDSAERGKKQCEAELAESREACNEMTSINSKAASDKRAIEGVVHTMHAEIDDTLMQAKNAEEKAKKAMVDAARLAEELRAEQDHTSNQNKAKRVLETQLSELEMKFAEANENAIRGGRNVMAKLETRIRELEVKTSIDELLKRSYKSKQNTKSRWSWATCRLTLGRTRRRTASPSGTARR